MSSPKQFFDNFFSFPDLKPSQDNTLGKSDVKKESAKASVATAAATKTSTSEKKSKAKGQLLEAPLMLALAGYISYLVWFDILKFAHDELSVERKTEHAGNRLFSKRWTDTKKYVVCRELDFIFFQEGL